MPWLRIIIGIVLGVAVAVGVISGIEAIDHFLYPTATTFDGDDPVSVAAKLAAMPFGAQALVVLGWFLGAFAGGWLAMRVSDRRWTGWLIAALIVAGGIANLFAFTHPLWMQLATVVVPLAGGALAARLHHRPYPGEPLLG